MQNVPVYLPDTAFTLKYGWLPTNKDIPDMKDLVRWKILINWTYWKVLWLHVQMVEWGTHDTCALISHE